MTLYGTIFDYNFNNFGVGSSFVVVAEGQGTKDFREVESADSAKRRTEEKNFRTFGKEEKNQQ